MTLQGLVVDCVMLTWHSMCICGCGVVCVGQSSVQLWRARSVRCLYACVPAVLPSQFSCAVVPASLRRSAHMLHRVVRPGWCPMARPVIHARPQACRMCRRRRGIVAAGGWARCDSWVHRGSLRGLRRIRPGEMTFGMVGLCGGYIYRARTWDARFRLLVCGFAGTQICGLICSLRLCVGVWGPVWCFGSL